MKTLTPEQADAIRSYAAQHGTRWKDQLLTDWMRAGSRTYRGEGCYLQQVRNQHGPSWLRSMTLEPITETTDQGENYVLDGAPRITQRQHLERQMTGKAQPRKPQKRVEGTELFSGLPAHQDKLI
jgi:hypothetical protein